MSGPLPVANAVQHLNEKGRRVLWRHRVISERLVAYTTYMERRACQEQRPLPGLGPCICTVIKTDSSTQSLQARFMTRQHIDVIHKHRGREERR